MYRFAVALGLVTTMAFAPALVPTQVHAKQTNASGVAIPIAGRAVVPSGSGTFSGTFSLLKFVNDHGNVVAVGTVAGTITDAAGGVVTTGLQTVALPVSIGQGATAAAAAAAVTC